ncbi:MAG: PEP-CTERM sorting domain-containing protein, partial [Verrucomicrobiaceae bacterium]
IVANGVTVTENFSSAPSASDWSTASMGTNSNGSVTTVAQMDTAVNSGIGLGPPPATNNVSPFTSSTATNAPAAASAYGTSLAARYNSAAGTLFTQPTNNFYTALMATVTNATGGMLTSLTLAYDLTVTKNGSGSEGVLAGHRVYFSTTGLAGSWTNVPDANGVEATGNVTATIGNLSWAAGANLYVLWADDNGTVVADDTLAIDNVSWTAVPEPSSVLLAGFGVMTILRHRRR